eukprot:8568887-Karenia_brevis.AAC.1
MQLRRETSVLLNRVWNFACKFKPEHVQRRMPLKVRRELLACMCLLPLMQTNLRSQIDNQLVATDASEYGIGVVASVGLTEAGMEAAERLWRTPSDMPVDKLALISLFDGIGGARRALDMLSVDVAAYAVSEVDESALR